MTTASPATDPIAALWREARSWLVDALRDFRGPAEIARTLACVARDAIRRRLLLIESLFMKLLLIEAARLPDCSVGTACAPASSAARARSACARAEDPANAQTWRVRFRLRIPRGLQQRASLHGVWRAPPRREAGATGAHSSTRANAVKLARRFEALRRVFADPRRAIARLARTLHALGRTAARRIALALPPRSTRLGGTLAAAIVHGCDASFSFPHDTS